MATKARVLVVGNGAREATAVTGFEQSPHVGEVICCPGNGGTAQRHGGKSRNVDIKASDIDALTAFAQENKFDLCWVGPEDPLADGIVNEWRAKGLGPIYGPTSTMALIESSKLWANETKEALGIPSPRYWPFEEAADALSFLATWPWPDPAVLKVIKLALGKGVKPCDNITQASQFLNRVFVQGDFGEDGKHILIEEFVEGPESSLIAICAGGRSLALPAAQDYKHIGEGNTGDMTGGMGCYSPVPHLDEALIAKYLDVFINPIVRELGYHGTLFAGLKGNEILEYNCRCGDPETQVQFTRVRNDLFELFQQAALGNLPDKLDIDPRPRVCVVLASGGYPGSYEKGKLITGLGDVANHCRNVQVLHAGTQTSDGINFYTCGGRVLSVVGRGDTIREASDAAYDAVDRIKFDGMYFRGDIAEEAA